MKAIEIQLGGKTHSVKALLEGKEGGEARLKELGLALFNHLNPNFPSNPESAMEWIQYLRWIVSGYENTLQNPYGDLSHYRLMPIFQNPKDEQETPLIQRIESTEWEPSTMDFSFFSKCLFILAVGGADTTFYNQMSPEEIEAFLRAVLPKTSMECFNPVLFQHGIPRAFIPKSDEKGREVTLVESLIFQAYQLGIRHMAILTNAMTAPSIRKFLEHRLCHLKDLHWTVTVQPLIPSPLEDSGKWIIAPEYGGFPGGHGHGMKYTFLDPTVKEWIQRKGLDRFVFCNGDNAMTFARGGAPFVHAWNAMASLSRDPAYQALRIAFFLVWENVQKGGFAFLLQHKKTRAQFPQIFEIELASGFLDLDTLSKQKAGYNTNIALGFIDRLSHHWEHLPMTLKQKEIEGKSRLLFEASLATAMATFRDEEGKAHFEPSSTMMILPPKECTSPHWLHFSLRKREEWLLYMSSLFRVNAFQTERGECLIIQCNRNFSTPFPQLKGNILNPKIVNTKAFFEIFQNAFLDMDEFTGTLRIEFVESKRKPRGEVRLKGNIRFKGNGEIVLKVPPGKKWIIEETTLVAPVEVSPS